jgi:DNA processing protein
VKSKKLTPDSSSFPDSLRTIPSAPKQLFYATKPGLDIKKLLNRPRVAIVGSRSVSPYGKNVTEKLAGELAQQGIVIISGLAIGVDGISHQAALNAGGHTIAVLPAGLDDIVPATNHRLAEDIIQGGGVLFTEYTAGTPALKQNFIARNRLVVGLAQAILITEAGENSGSLHSAKFAREQGKPVLVVPGQITSPTSRGTNGLLKEGASAVTSSLDVLEALGQRPSQTRREDVRGDTAEQQALLDLLQQGIVDAEELLKSSELSASSFNQTLITLELAGKIRSLGGNQWALR